MHPNKALRKAAIGILRDAPNMPETILDHPPKGGSIDPTKLPVVFCYVRAERVEEASQKTKMRTVLVDFVIEVSGADDEVLDKVDDFQLALERAFIATPRLGGWLESFEITGSELMDKQKGEFSFAMRRITYEARTSVPRLDPVIKEKSQG